MRMKISSLFLPLAVSLSACAAAPPKEPASLAETPVEKPSKRVVSPADEGKECIAAGGKCIPEFATVACKDEPATDCGSGMYCCGK
jgi:hypothetical protein